MKNVFATMNINFLYKFGGFIIIVLIECLWDYDSSYIYWYLFYRFVLFIVAIYYLMKDSVHNNLERCCVIILSFLISLGILGYKQNRYHKRCMEMSHYKVVAILINKYEPTYKHSPRYNFQYYSNECCLLPMNVTIKECYLDFAKAKIGDTILIKMRDTINYWDIVEYYPKNVVAYSKPVLFVNNVEFGNDYYYYAKLRPDLALKNFGLNKLTLGKDNLLYYKNVNDSIDSQVHQCADSLQSQLNRDMLDTADAFYFHGEIIPAEQVFSEIPQTRAYYERYCGKLE